VQNRVADVALFHSLELVVQVPLPQHQSVPDGTILRIERYILILVYYKRLTHLVGQENSELFNPLFPLCDIYSVVSFNFDGA